MAHKTLTRVEQEQDLVLRGSIKPGYDVFIIVVTVLSIFNWILLMLPTIPFEGDRDVRGLLIFMEPIFTAILLLDFWFRLKRAKGRRWHYLNREGGWLDFLGSLPYGRALRIFRLVRVLQGFHQFGWRATLKWFIANRAQGTLFLVLAFLIVVLEFGGILVLWFEAGQPGANIETGGEALWWGVVTITTVGYGDYYPVTGGGEIVATIMIFSGVALISIFTAWVASTFLAPAGSQAAKAAAASATDTDQAPGTTGTPGTPGAADADATDPSALIADLRSRLDQLEAVVAKGGGGS